MHKIREWNSYYKEKEDLEEDSLRKLSQVGADIDKSLYYEYQSNKIKRDGPYGNFYRKKQNLPHSEKMNY